MNFLHRYKEGNGAYAGSGIYATNEPVLGLVCMVIVGRAKAYFRFRWGSWLPRRLFLKFGLLNG